jgi:hypothetical protein
MKAGTAQKLILNMISTSAMIRLGRVRGNKMVDMQLTNNKLVDRGVRMILEEHKIDYEAAKRILLKYGNVRDAWPPSPETGEPTGHKDTPGVLKMNSGILFWLSWRFSPLL